MHKHGLHVLRPRVGSPLGEVHVVSETPALGPSHVTLSTAHTSFHHYPSTLSLSADEETEAPKQDQLLHLCGP